MPQTPSKIGRVSVADLSSARAEGSLDAGAQQLLEAEGLYVDAYRRHCGRPPTNGDDLAALCISGGGIRSASFALGVLQALAARDLLKRFDYLSTVSGGGYVGSSFTWLLSRAAKEIGVPEFGLSPDTFPYGTANPSAGEPDSDVRRDTAEQIGMLSYLRGHGRYLTPGRGISLASLIAVAIRGAFLSLLVSVPLAAAGIGVVMLASTELTGDPEAGFAFFRHLGAGILVALGAVTIVYSVVTFFHRPLAESGLKYRMRRFYDRYAGTLLVAAVSVTAIGFVDDVHIHVGTGALLLGFAKAALLFVISSHWRVRVPAKPAAVIASALVLYGALVFSHRLALWGFETVGGETAWPVWTPFALLALAAVCGRFVNLNYVSMHRYYRDRLMETFMPDVSSALSDLTGPAHGANGARVSEMNRVEHPTGPYHVLNTSVNLVGAESRLRRSRGGDSFILSSTYCGSNETGWRRTDEFLSDGLTLATAMAVSGAAAEPNAGEGGRGLTRDASVAMLMTLLNLTLGFWIPHPLRTQRRTRFPNHLNPGLLSFVAAAYTTRRTFLELGDGGHFENLGLYEMVRRRARLIVVSDAGCDPQYRFHDLLNALRKIEVDFGARIYFCADDGRRVDPRAHFADVELPRDGHVTGRVVYADGSTARLVLVKASMVADLSLAITGFRDRHPAFPHESTANQEFDEEHVETYRRLGYELTRRMIADGGLET